MARICAFVFNPVVRDARVVKQANSLAAQGHHVTLIGLADNNFPETHAKLASGVEVWRVPRGDGNTKKSGKRPGGVIARLENVGRRIVNRHLHLLLIPFALAYLGIVALTVTREEKIDGLVDLVFLAILAAGLMYLVSNFSKLIDAALFLIEFGLRKILSAPKAERVRHRLMGALRHVAPQLLDDAVDRRTQYRIDQMVEMARSLGPDIVHCHDAHTLPVGAKVKRLTGCRLIYDAHEIYEEIAQGNAAAAKRYRGIHTQFLDQVDGFITINESIAGWYKDNYPVIPQPVVLMNATLRTPPFEYDGRLHDAVGLPRDGKILLYQGGFARKRGLEYLIQSATYLPADWTLVMMGWGKIEGELRQLADGIDKAASASRSGAAPVRFLPAVPQSELAYWSAGATIGVIPYEKVGLNHWFCTPNKLWEYPNAGVPVLVSPFPELRGMVETYRYGWLLPEEQDPKLLAQQLAALTDEEIARAKAACADFSDVENWSKYEKLLVGLYDRLLRKPEPVVVTQTTQPALGT